MRTQGNKSWVKNPEVKGGGFWRKFEGAKAPFNVIASSATKTIRAVKDIPPKQKIAIAVGVTVSAAVLATAVHDFHAFDKNSSLRGGMYLQREPTLGDVMSQRISGSEDMEGHVEVYIGDTADDRVIIAGVKERRTLLADGRKAVDYVLRSRTVSKQAFDRMRYYPIDLEKHGTLKSGDELKSRLSNLADLLDKGEDGAVPIAYDPIEGSCQNVAKAIVGMEDYKEAFSTKGISPLGKVIYRLVESSHTKSYRPITGQKGYNPADIADYLDTRTKLGDLSVEQLEAGVKHIRDRCEGTIKVPLMTKIYKDYLMETIKRIKGENRTDAEQPTKRKGNMSWVKDASVKGGGFWRKITKKTKQIGRKINTEENRGKAKAIATGAAKGLGSLAVGTTIGYVANPLIQKGIAKVVNMRIAEIDRRSAKAKESEKKKREARWAEEEQRDLEMLLAEHERRKGQRSAEAQRKIEVRGINRMESSRLREELTATQAESEMKRNLTKGGDLVVAPKGRVQVSDLRVEQPKTVAAYPKPRPSKNPGTEMIVRHLMNKSKKKVKTDSDPIRTQGNKSWVKDLSVKGGGFWREMKGKKQKLAEDVRKTGRNLKRVGIAAKAVGKYEVGQAVKKLKEKNPSLSKVLPADTKTSDKSTPHSPKSNRIKDVATGAVVAGSIGATLYLKSQKEHAEILKRSQEESAAELDKAREDFAISLQVMTTGSQMLLDMAEVEQSAEKQRYRNTVKEKIKRKVAIYDERNAAQLKEEVGKIQDKMQAKLDQTDSQKKTYTKSGVKLSLEKGLAPTETAKEKDIKAANAELADKHYLDAYSKLQLGFYDNITSKGVEGSPIDGKNPKTAGVASLGQAVDFLSNDAALPKTRAVEKAIVTHQLKERYLYDAKKRVQAYGEKAHAELEDPKPEDYKKISQEMGKMMAEALKVTQDDQAFKKEMMTLYQKGDKTTTKKE